MDINANPEDLTGIEDEFFGEVNLLYKSLNQLDDRGLILSLAAFAEESLGALLKACMLPFDTTKELIDNFNAPLGTFSSRIKIAYSIGLITKDHLLDLERLRKIRNKFAHSWKPIDITNPAVLAWIEDMSYSRLDANFPETPLEKITTSMICLLIELRSISQQLSKYDKKLKSIGFHLIPGFSGDFDEQLRNASKELNDILQNIASPQAKKQKFYTARVASFISRLTTLEAKTSEQRDEVLAFQAEAQSKLSQYLARPASLERRSAN